MFGISAVWGRVVIASMTAMASPIAVLGFGEHRVFHSG